MDSLGSTQIASTQAERQMRTIVSPSVSPIQTGDQQLSCMLCSWASFPQKKKKKKENEKKTKQKKQPSWERDVCLPGPYPIVVFWQD